MKDFISLDKLGVLRIDRVFVEQYTPILFTCLDGDNGLYLVVSYFQHRDEEKWLLTKVSSETILALLRDKITIREAFLSPDEKKYRLQRKNEQIELIEEPFSLWQDESNTNLPTPNEYMDADPDEFEEEITHYENFISYEYKPKMDISYVLNRVQENVFLKPATLTIFNDSLYTKALDTAQKNVYLEGGTYTVHTNEIGEILESSEFKSIQSKTIFEVTSELLKCS